MKTLFYAATAALALLVVSCQKEQTGKQTDALKTNRQLNFIYSHVIKPDEVITPVPMDSNTAIIQPTGDTLFPRWYYKEKAANTPNGRQAGIMAVPTDYRATINDPKKTAATSQIFQITCTNVYQSAEVTIYDNLGNIYSLGNATPTTPGGLIEVPATLSVACNTYYVPEIFTYSSNNPDDKIIQISKMPFYTYSFQQFVGQGTAYGADMKMLNFEGFHTGTELLSVIANRSSTGINGLSYLIYKELDKNGNVTAGHTGLRTLQMQASSSAPKGAAAALANLDNVGIYTNDMVLATYTKLNTESAYSIKYLVGLNLNETNGIPTWLQQPNAPLTVPGFGNDIVDIGAVISDFDKNGTLDLMFMGFSTNGIYYRIGYNLNASNGSADFSSPVKLLYRPEIPVFGGGIDGNGDSFVVGIYATIKGVNKFQTVVWAWDVADQVFDPTVRLWYYRETVGASTAGAGVAIGRFDAGLSYDILSMAYVGGSFRFVVDFAFNPSPSSKYSPYFQAGLCGAHTN